MIACISLADINAEEMLNTLKYANRAYDIQNKPVVNCDPKTNEMLKMCQQLEYLQAELCACGGSDEVHEGFWIWNLEGHYGEEITFDQPCMMGNLCSLLSQLVHWTQV
ncbi:hypothetical protein SLEP1_g4994 [Rubroshorea leprosula]|uniref:Kinesin motor domain-containing protein n=1 Tax=Rubroshorea leprosula TaxID=152421 RepID=A0AAV5HWF6_9ROSI|nr:hypothetical protein SLEP1_g4994 [Rubroshorea leprosula]